MDAGRIIRPLQAKLDEVKADGLDVMLCSTEIIENVIAMLKEQNWVKCSDRMPEEQETIFAKFKGTDKWSPAMLAQSSEDVRVVIVFADGTRRVSHSHTIDGKWECEKSPVKRTVTHWMPNPGLPEEGR